MTDAEKLLRRIGATKMRETKHQVWRLPNDKLFTMAQTASDVRAVRNQVAEIERLMGWRSRNARVGTRRTAKQRHRNPPSPWESPAVGVRLRDFREQLGEVLSPS